MFLYLFVHIDVIDSIGLYLNIGSKYAISPRQCRELRLNVGIYLIIFIIFSPQTHQMQQMLVFSLLGLALLGVFPLVEACDIPCPNRFGKQRCCDGVSPNGKGLVPHSLYVSIAYKI